MLAIVLVLFLCVLQSCGHVEGVFRLLREFADSSLAFVVWVTSGELMSELGDLAQYIFARSPIQILHMVNVMSCLAFLSIYISNAATTATSTSIYMLMILVSYGYMLIIGSYRRIPIWLRSERAKQRCGRASVEE